MQPAIFADHEIRRVYDEETETWWFSLVDILQVLTKQPVCQIARKYWNKLKEQLAHELCTASPEMKGFSPRNLKYMRAILSGRLNTPKEGLK